MEEFKIDKDPILKINRIWIPANRLNEGLENARHKSIDSIFVIPAHNEEKLALDFSYLKSNQQVKALEITAPLGNGSKIEGIYDLKKMIRLSYFEYDRFPLDNSKLISLKYLYTHYSKNLEANNSLKLISNLEHLKIWYLNTNNCMLFSGLTKLKKLDIAWGNISSLHGLQFLPILNTVSLYGLKNIISMEELLLNSKILNIDIEKCKNISDTSFEVGSDYLERLYIDNINTLSFISRLTNMKFLSFNKCESNDLSYLIQLPTLEKVWFPDKKRYSLKMNDINTFLFQRNR